MQLVLVLLALNSSLCRAIVLGTEKKKKQMRLSHFAGQLGIINHVYVLIFIVYVFWLVFAMSQFCPSFFFFCVEFYFSIKSLITSLVACTFMGRSDLSLSLGLYFIFAKRKYVNSGVFFFLFYFDGVFVVCVKTGWR